MFRSIPVTQNAKFLVGTLLSQMNVMMYKNVDFF